LRNANTALNSGGVEKVASDGRVLRYERFDQEQRFAIVLNLSDGRVEARVDSEQIVACTHMDRSSEAIASNLSLRPFEGVVVKLA
jgi:alpha-glucosidase